MADQLAKAWADDPRVMVFNHLSLTHHGKHTCIDHLVLHPRGCILIESRSLHGELRVNRFGAWSRYAHGQWVATSSPLHRLEVQQTLLMALLRANRHRLADNDAAIPRLLEHGEWQILSVLPDMATLDRDPRAPQVSVVAAANIGKRIHRLIGPRGILGSLTTPCAPRLRKTDLEQLGQILQAHDAQCRTRRSVPTLTMLDTVTGARCSFPATFTPAFWQEVVIGDLQPIACRGCGTRHGLVDCYGRLGYFLKCTDCGVITSMNQACYACGDTTLRVSRTGPTYTAQCPRCCFERVLFVSGS
ncbi:nuclease-related domain-containing protein [Halomonas sp. YLGW01]|uniref:nuclease-related domain-containing protein n=1 Tax=Halomonas sp. YLGW01 TaxID=2773308 RepID=UPI0017872212|nr:nuclease-related domain-containing protein [Halomonas sp. YLGW01]